MKSQFQQFNDDQMPSSGPGSSKSEQDVRAKAPSVTGTTISERLQVDTKVLRRHNPSRVRGEVPAADQHEPLEPTKFFTIAQVAEMVGVSTRTVRRWIKRDELVAHRFGGVARIAESDLRAFFSRHRGK